MECVEVRRSVERPGVDPAHDGKLAPARGPGSAFWALESIGGVRTWRG